MNTWAVGEGFARSGLRHSETLRSVVGARHRLSPQEIPLCDVSLGRCVVMWGRSMEPVTSAIHWAPSSRQCQDISYNRVLLTLLPPKHLSYCTLLPGS